MDASAKEIDMAILVGYVPRAEGRAALRRGAEEARMRQTKLVVINSNRGGRDLDQGNPLQLRSRMRGGQQSEGEQGGSEHARRVARAPGFCNIPVS